MGLFDLVKGNMKKGSKKQTPTYYSRPTDKNYVDSLYAQVNYSSAAHKTMRAYSSKYFKGMEELESMWSVMYNLKLFSGEKADIFQSKCQENISDLHKMLDANKKYGFDDRMPPHVPAYVRLCMLYEKQEKYERAINICVEAINAGAISDNSKGKMYGRLARLIRKSGLAVSDDVLQLANKS